MKYYVPFHSLEGGTYKAKSGCDGITDDAMRDYLDGDMPRMFFDMDFDHYFVKYYPAMERQNPDMAQCFAYYLSEQGVDISEKLSDAEHTKLIRRQFRKLTEAIKDGIW